MRTNLDCGRNKHKTRKMKNKILIVAAFAMAAAFFLTGCIVVNVERNAPPASGASTNTAAAPVAK